MAFKKYVLTSTQLQKLANLCVQEQGSLAGVKAEASLMANQLETSEARQKKYGTNGQGLFKWVRDGKWYANAEKYMNGTNVGKEYVNAVKDVLVNGNRVLPVYVDEHDCLSDIKSISTGAVKDRADYVSGKTIINNKYGSTYTFHSFPAPDSDPFGYTAEAYAYAKQHGLVDDARTVKASDIISRANYYIGYEEKASPNHLDSFHANVGSKNFQKFQPLANAGNGDEWCQFFVCGVAVEVCGSISAAEKLLWMGQSSSMTGYTPDGASYFKSAGQWYSVPEPGDVVYFYSEAKGRIGHTGYVVSVNRAKKTFITTEGNTRTDAYAENGGCVAQHEYSYATIGGTNRVNGFGRPRYGEITKGGGEVKKEVEVNRFVAYMPTIQKGDVGLAVKLWQTIIGAEADGEFGSITQALTSKWQTAHKVTNDGIVGKETWKIGLRIKQLTQ